MPLFPRSGLPADRQLCEQITRSGETDLKALRGMRQHICGGQQSGEILSRLCGKDTPQTESGKREKQAFTDKNNYIASTANEYPFCEKCPRCSMGSAGILLYWDSPKPLKIEKGRDETICRILRYDHDKLETAETMRIERRIYFEAKDGEIAPMFLCRWNSYTPCARKARQRNRRFLMISQAEPPHGRNRREERFCWIKHLNM